MHQTGSRLTPRPLDAYPARPGDWRARLRAIPWLTLVVVAAGGVLGALARQGLWAVFPRHPGVFDWTTLGIDAAGCFLLGALMTVISEIRHAHRLTGPFLGVGVLGGFTTFSTYIIDAQKLIASGAPQAGLAYLGVTLAAAILAVYAGVTLTRLAARTHRRERA
jgi:CrcB protein